ncbi:MAG: type II secretion system protein GspN [Deltaproteobacteria bacterium]|nr:type II secretion system protein GspN [Deltaproteobacteria bacterium]
MKIGLKLPSLTLTKGDVPTDGKGGMRAFARRLRSIAGWGAISLAFFLLFTWLCLPTRAIAWRIGHEARKAGYIIDVRDVSVSLLGNITLEDVTWTFEPSRPDAVPGKFLLTTVDVDVSFLSLLVGNMDIDVEAHAVDGVITAHYERDAEQSSIQIEVADLPLYDVPKARQALNAPLSGLFALKVALEMPGNKFAKAAGTIELTCAACSIGDGEAKLYIPGSKGLKDGTVIPQIDLGTFTGKMVVEKGKATTEGLMETKSEDIELSVEGDIEFKDPVQKSRIDMTLKLNLTEKLQQRSEKLRLVFQGADAKSRLDPPEQGLGYVLSGAISNPKFRGIKAKTARDSRAEKRARQAKRDAAKRKKDEAKGKPKPGETDAKDDAKAEIDARPSLPGGPTPPMPPTGGDAMPTPTKPGANPLDVENDPPPGGATTAPPSEPPPSEPPPSEPPPPDPNVEPPPPDSGEQNVEEVPTILPPDGSFGGSGGPIGEPVQ